jgi:2,4-dienoyl-CoA reductase-like NADH-dependent reductase (Old Yellow Enzyme family)
MRAREPGRIGQLALPNRIFRAPTAETMADERGGVTDALVNFYRRLGAGGAGLVSTGHIFVHPTGRHVPSQMGLYDDSLIEGHARLAAAVHAEGGRIFAELGHAGSQSIAPGVKPLAPSKVVNPMTGVVASEITPDEIAQVIQAFGRAALRAKDAGYDGIHFAGANGYLFSQFMSPYANRRTDQWGGDAEGRGRFLFEVARSIRAAIGPDFPFIGRIGLADTIPGGLDLAEGLDRLAALDGLKLLDGVEPALNIIADYQENIRPYVAVGPARALQDWLFHRIASPANPEAYFQPLAHEVKKRVKMPVILMGGIRSTETMERILASGDADFVALARPFIREPDIARQIAKGRRGNVDCVSCNACLMHDGIDPLQCWRTPKIRLAHHFYTVLWRDRVSKAS